jgi:hypothetical protein
MDHALGEVLLEAVETGVFVLGHGPDSVWGRRKQSAVVASCYHCWFVQQYRQSVGVSLRSH